LKFFKALHQKRILMIICLVFLIGITHCMAMDMPVVPATLKPNSGQTPDSFCVPLAGRGKFSPDGKTVLVGTKHEDCYFTNKGDLHIQEIASGKKTLLEKSTSSSLDPKKSYGHNWYKFSWSPRGSLVKAEYFTEIKTIVRGQDVWRGKETETEIPLQVLKVWDTQGRLLYQRHQSFCNKSYFSADDAYLLVKERENPLRVFDARTGALLAALGQPTHHELPLPVDPCNAWILQLSPDMKETFFYNQGNFSLVGCINAWAKKWSTDGSKIVGYETPEFDASNEHTCEYRDGKYLAHFCAIYNRQLQKTHRFNSGWLHRFSISPNQKTVTAYNHEEQLNYNLESGSTVQLKSNSYERKYGEFLLPDGSGKISLDINHEGNFTVIGLSTGDTEQKFLHVPTIINRIRFTRIPEVILLANHDAECLLHTRTLTLTPLAWYFTKGLNKTEPVTFVNQDGYYITKEKNGYYMRKLS
jgi:hypothetical protein